MTLPKPYSEIYREHHAAIQLRLNDFAAVKPKDWFYECAFCVLTPQSKAAHAGVVIDKLKQVRFQQLGTDPTPILRDKSHYIRFHNVKAKRLQSLREIWREVEARIKTPEPALEKRNALADLIPGVGMKEASHFLRNIGVRGLGILDRHILVGLAECGVYDEIPSLSTRAKYLDVEQQFVQYANAVRIDTDVLDLVFWCKMTGYIYK